MQQIEDKWYAGKDWGQEKKGTTEDEMAKWHHLLDGHEFGWTPGVGDGQGGLSISISISIYNRENTISLTSGAGKTGQPPVKEWN